jgi:Peptidase family M28
MAATTALIASTPVALGEASSAIPADPAITTTLKTISASRVQGDIAKLVSFGTRSTLSAQDPASIAAGRGIGAAREWIKSQFESDAKACGGCLEVKTDRFIQEPADRIKQPTELVNVYAVLRGSDPQAAQRIVLVTGHYDSRDSDPVDGGGDAPGANDDASGVAVSLECARALSHLKLPATIVFLTVAGEEEGLYGSAHFAKMAKQQGWQIEAVLNNDIVGGDRNPGQNPATVRIFSEGVPASAGAQQLQEIRLVGGENDSASRNLARYILETAAAYPIGLKPALIYRLDRYHRGGDHRSFNEQGYAAVRFTEYREDFNHQHQNPRLENGVRYGDLLRYVDFDYVAKVARLNAATLASLAAAPARPVNVRVVLTTPTNNTNLKWDAVPGASGYEVLWRTTSSPNWEHALKVGSTTHSELEISIDNLIFAVRAYDVAGHRSLASLPLSEL